MGENVALWKAIKIPAKLKNREIGEEQREGLRSGWREAYAKNCSHVEEFICHLQSHGQLLKWMSGQLDFPCGGKKKKDLWLAGAEETRMHVGRPVRKPLQWFGKEIW